MRLYLLLNVGRISIVITAHDRMEYLMNAVNSVINQTIGISRIELIVVKNFKNAEIDQKLDSIGAKRILTSSESTGEKIALGIEICTENVISFLDDDDEFAINKLELVLANFQSNRELSLYHNGSIKFRADGTLIPEYANNVGETRISLSGDQLTSNFKNLYVAKSNYNISSFSISREFAVSISGILKKLKTNIDTALLFLAADRGHLIIADNAPLTKILAHDSLSRSCSWGRDFKDAKIDFMNKSTKTLDKLKSFMKDGKLIGLVDCQIWELKMLINLMDSGKFRGLVKPSIIVKSVRLFPGIYILKILAATFLSYLAPGKISELYRSYSIQNRTW